MGTATIGSNTPPLVSAELRRKQPTFSSGPMMPMGPSVRAESQLYQNASPEIQINLLLSQPGDDSEYARLVASITPLLEGVWSTELTDGDLKFLERQTDETADHLAIFRRAATLEANTSVPAEAFYGFGRIGLPLNLTQLIKEPREELQKALLVAIKKKIRWIFT
jgi:hypothetical protein